MTSTTIYLLKGRSIDGVCWRSGEGWADMPGLATAYNTHEGVAGALAEALWAYNHASLEATVGCLEIKTMLRVDYDKAVTDAYAEMMRGEWDEECSG